MTTSRVFAAEAVGTGFLVMAVVGSGIMGERLAGGNAALALLANSMATGAALATLIFTFGPISGAHFNPLVTLVAASEGGRSWAEVPTYFTGQILGGLLGVIAANAMFEEPLIALSQTHRGGLPLLLSEVVATFGLFVVIHGTGKQVRIVPLTVAAYITAAYWFTASTSFANPVVTIARAFTDTFTGIRPHDVAGFIIAQAIGAGAATLLFRWFEKGESEAFSKRP